MHRSRWLAMWRWRGLLGLVLPFFIPFTTWAASNTSAQAYVVSISRLYESLEYEHALEQIHRARQGPLSPKEEVTVFLYEGIILIELGQQEKGTDAFKSALQLLSHPLIFCRQARRR